MAISVAYFRGIFPEFDATDSGGNAQTIEDGRQITDEVVERMINVAAHIFSAQPLGQAYLTAHLCLVTAMEKVTVDDGRGERTGAGEHLTLKAMAEKGSEVFYTTTSYGRTFLTLKKTRAQRNMPLVV